MSQQTRSQVTATETRPPIQSYKDLEVWQMSMTVVEGVYTLTNQFPQAEHWGLMSQMRRSAVSVPSNIAEGYGRQATGEYRHHLSMARGSLMELETQLLLAERLGFSRPKEVGQIL